MTTKTANEVRTGDRIIDPKNGRGTLRVFNVEALGDVIYFDATTTKRGTVARKVWASEKIEVR